MSPLISTQRAPLWGVALPFMAGIYSYDLGITSHLTALAGCCALLLYLLHLLLYTPTLRHRHTYLKPLALYLFAFVLGSLTLQWQQCQRSNIPQPQYPQFCAIITSDVEQHPHSISYKIALLNYLTKEGNEVESNSRAILYMRPDRSALSLKRNEIITCTNRLKTIENYPNPESFDYATYMRRYGYELSQFSTYKDWKRVGARPPSWRDRVAEWRSRGVELIQESQLPPTQQALIESLLLGCTNHLTDGQREAFSNAGLSHILAVSGLHMGIITLLILTLLYPLRWIDYRLQLGITLGVLWLYATFTGLSPATVRASIMSSCLIVAQLVGRRNSSLNALALAALIMLGCNAQQLFMAGFQLSFVATLSILLFQPILYRLLPTKWLPLRYLWGWVSVTLAAQIGVLPIALYYFHELPLLLLLTNLVVVPLLPLLMGCGIVWMGIAYLGGSCAWLTLWLGEMLGWLEGVTQWSVGSSLEHIYLTPQQLLLYFVLVTLGYLLLWKRHLIYLGAMVVIGVVALLLPSREPLGSALIVYHDSQESFIELVSGTRNYLLLPDTTATREEGERLSYNFRLKHGLDAPIFVTDTLHSDHITVEFPFITYYNTTLVVANNKVWKELKNPIRREVDYCIVSKGYSGGLTTLQRMFAFKEVILTANLNYFSRKYLIIECQKQGVAYYNIRECGAWVLPKAPQIGAD